MKEVNQYSKEALVKSRRYQDHRDLLQVLLESGTLYTTETVDKLITDFMKGKVN